MWTEVGQFPMAGQQVKLIAITGEVVFSERRSDTTVTGRIYQGNGRIETNTNVWTDVRLKTETGEQEALSLPGDPQLVPGDKVSVFAIESETVMPAESGPKKPGLQIKFGPVVRSASSELYKAINHTSRKEYTLPINFSRQSGAFGCLAVIALFGGVGGTLLGLLAGSTVILLVGLACAVLLPFVIPVLLFSGPKNAKAAEKAFREAAPAYFARNAN